MISGTSVTMTMPVVMTAVIHWPSHSANAISNSKIAFNA